MLRERTEDSKQQTSPGTVKLSFNITSLYEIVNDTCNQLHIFRGGGCKKAVYDGNISNSKISIKQCQII